MSPDQFLNKLVQAIGKLKAPALILIFVFVLLQVTSNVFMGSGDKKTAFSTVVGLIILAALVFYSDKFVLWLSSLF